MDKIEHASKTLEVPIRWTFEAVDRIINRVTNFFSGIAVGAVLLIFGLIFVNVFLRYVFSQPFRHTDEIVRLTNSWIVYFGLAYTFRQGRHISIKAVTSRLPDSLQQKVETAGALMVAIWVAMLTFGGWRLWLELFRSKELSFGLLEIMLWIPGLCIILGLTWFLLEILLDLVGRIVGWTSTPE